MKKEKKIVHSGLECLECGDKIFSEYRHDFKECKCGACFVDGGTSYFRIGYKDESKIKFIYRLEDGTIV